MNLQRCLIAIVTAMQFAAFAASAYATDTQPAAPASVSPSTTTQANRPTPPLPAQSINVPGERDCARLAPLPNSHLNRFTSPPHGSTFDRTTIGSSFGGRSYDVWPAFNEQQLRIEQLHCEQLNLKDKLDYILRKLER